MKWKEVVDLLRIDEYKQLHSSTRACSRHRPLENGEGDSASIGSNDGVVRVPGRIFSAQAIPEDKALVIILNVRNFKTKASSEPPIDIL